MYKAVCTSLSKSSSSLSNCCLANVFALNQHANRSPVLALIESSAILLLANTFILQELLRMGGQHLPCWIPVWEAYAMNSPIVCTAILFRCEQSH